MKKRILSVLLALCMAVTLLPTVALAGDATDEAGLRAQLASGNARLTANITATSDITVSSNTTLDLGGKTLTMGDYSIVVTEGMLTVTDTVDPANGKITGTPASNYGGVIELNGGSLTVSNGNISASGAYKYAIKSNSTGTVTVSGGKVEVLGGTAVYCSNACSGAVTITDSGVVSGYSTYENVIKLDTGSSAPLTISGGEVKCTNTDSFQNTLIGNFGTGGVTISGGKVSVSTENDIVLTWGVSGASQVTVTGGTILGGDNTTYGENGQSQGYSMYGNGLGSIKILGGTIKGRMENLTPTDGTNSICMTTLTLMDGTTAKANTSVTALTTDAGYTYGMTDVKTDGSGRIFVFLPDGKTVTAAATADGSYVGSVEVDVMGASGNLTKNAAPAAITGTVTISGTEEYDSELTAAVTATNNTGTLSYQWKRGTTNIGTNSNEYTLAAADIGQTITCDVTSSVQTGTISSSPTGTIGKKQLTVSGTAALSKSYDDSALATVTLGTVGGAITGDDVTVTPSGSFSDKNVGSDKNVTVTYALSGSDAGNYLPPNNDTVSANISRAIPTGTPTYTAISTTGKTLGDAALLVGTITPAGGSIAWNLGASQTVTANTAYRWTYTPADSANYENLTGSITPYVVSSSSGGGSSSRYYTLSFNTNGGNSVSQISRASGTEVTLSAYTPQRDGYVFAGWYSDAVLTKSVTSVTLSANTTVYAKWTQKAVTPTVNPFHDVKESDWFYEDVLFVFGGNLMQGTGDTAFNPHGTTTRGMAAAILYRLEGQPSVSGSCPFRDVMSESYYEDAVTWAAENQIVGGYGNAVFSPESPVTREQLAAILYRYAAWKGYDVSAAADLSGFADDETVSGYAVDAVRWASAGKLLQGSNGSLRPDGNAERCQVAAIFHRFCSMNLA